MSSDADLIRALVAEDGDDPSPTSLALLRDWRRRAIGAVYPRAFVAAAGGQDRWRVSTELLVRGARPRLSVEPRFLHVVDRSVFRAADDGLEPADELAVDGEPIAAGEEVRERAVVLAGLRLDAVGDARMPIEVSAGSECEALANGRAIRRRWGALAGELEVRWRRLSEGLLRVGVTVSNGYTHRVADRDEANHHALLAVHVFLGVEGGAFVSSLEPPKDLELAVLGCRNDGLFPVLLGKAAARDRVLASPVILYQPYRQPVGGRDDTDVVGTRAVDGMAAPRVLTEADAVRAEIHPAESGVGGSQRRFSGDEAGRASDAMLRLHDAIRDWQVLRLIGSTDEPTTHTPTTQTPVTLAGPTRPGGR